MSPALLLAGWLGLSGCAADVVALEYLAVINVAPPHGAAGIGLDTQAAITFSAPLDPDTVPGAVELLDSDGAPVGIALNYDRGSYTVLVQPSDALLPDSRYTLSLATSLYSDEVGALAAPLSSSFSTAGADAPADAAPLAAILTPAAACTPGVALSLDGSASYDPEGEALEWSWSVAEAPAGYSLDPADAAAPSLTVDAAGSWLIQLVVSDGARESAPDWLSLDCEER